MIEYFLSIVLSCAQVDLLISSISEYEQVQVKEITDILKNSNPECFNE